MSWLPPHLSFLEALRVADHPPLEDYYHETATGELTPHSSEGLFKAGGITYVGAADGSMVPIWADGLEPMEGNIWDAGKFSALVEAIEAGHNPRVYPGYADVWLEDGQLRAQVRDGNHRTFAPVAAGSDFSWVILSRATAQDINERLPGTERLYRAIRAAQRERKAPQLQRRKRGRVKSSHRQELVALEREYATLTNEIADHYRGLLETYGAARSGFSLAQQMERPQLFWRLRAKELLDEHGSDWHEDHIIDTPEGKAQEERWSRHRKLGPRLWKLREAAGLQHGERLDVRTGTVVRGNPDVSSLKEQLMR